MMASRSTIAQTHVKDIAVLKEKVNRLHQEQRDTKTQLKQVVNSLRDIHSRSQGRKVAVAILISVASFGAGVVATIIQLKGIIG